MSGQSTPQLPRHTIKRIIKNQHPQKYSSKDAVEQLAEESEKHIEKILDEAKDLSEYADRKTIRKQDIETAVKKINTR